MKNKGFTMIELLVVIAVIGILAVAVLSAINPIEQINRGKDTGSRSDAEQLISAIDRYYATKGKYPWQNTPDDGLEHYAWAPQNVESSQVLLNLSNSTSELKKSFIKRITNISEYNTLYLYNNGVTGDSSYVCFMPKSKAFEDDATTRCAGDLPGDVDAVTSGLICGGVSNAYSCLP